jgi:hypothetical protein
MIGSVKITVESVMQDFVHSEGLYFLDHALKRVSDGFLDGYTEWFPEFGLNAPARTMSTIRTLGSLCISSESIA